MPIEVRHDISGGAIARLAALSGIGKQQNIEADRAEKAAARDQQAFLTVQGREQQDRQQSAQLQQQRAMQAAQLQQAQSMQDERIQAAAEGQQRASDMEMIRKQAMMPMEIEMMEEEQRLRNEGWEHQYSAKSRQDLARINESMQQVRSKMASGEIDPITGQSMLKRLWETQNGVSKVWSPPDPNKPPEEQMPGYQAIDKHGNVTVNDKDGIPRVEQAWYDTPDGRKQKFEWEKAIKQLDIRKAEMTAQAALENDKREFEYELRTTPRPNTDDKGVETVGTHLPSDDEVRKAMRMRWGPEPPTAWESRQIERGGEGAQRSINAIREYDIQLTKGEEEALDKADPRALEAVVYIKAAAKEYENKPMPDEVLQQMQEASKLLEQLFPLGQGSQAVSEVSRVTQEAESQATARSRKEEDLRRMREAAISRGGF